MDKQERKSIGQFNNWAKNYDRNFFLPFYFSNKFILNNLKPRNADSILDIGCGTGILLKLLSDLNLNLKLHGIDIADEMASSANKKISYDKALIQLATSHSLPYKEHSFNFVTCATSFHHYPRPQMALNEMFRVLKENGKLLILDPHTNGLFRKIICQLLNNIFREEGAHIYSKETIKSMFKDAGFNNIEQKSYLHYKLLTIGKKI